MLFAWKLGCSLKHALEVTDWEQLFHAYETIGEAHVHLGPCTPLKFWPKKMKKVHPIFKCNLAVIVVRFMHLRLPIAAELF